MFIVKKRSEIARFGLFLLLVGLLVWFVSGRVDLWRVSERPAEPPPTNRPLVTAPPAVGAAELDLTEGHDYFAEYRIARERSRGALGERLRELMDSPSADEAVRREASQQYLELGRTADRESRAEAMVKARGFEDVIVHLSEGSAQVVVKAASLSQQQVVQVMDTVSRVTGVKSTAITVMAKYR
ncbi:MAG: SpoIIIAH-like family protein [Bacillota bacterium]